MVLVEAPHQRPPERLAPTAVLLVVLPASALLISAMAAAPVVREAKQATRLAPLAAMQCVVEQAVVLAAERATQLMEPAATVVEAEIGLAALVARPEWPAVQAKLAMPIPALAAAVADRTPRQKAMAETAASPAAVVAVVAPSPTAILPVTAARALVVKSG